MKNHSRMISMILSMALIISTLPAFSASVFAGDTNTVHITFHYNYVGAPEAPVSFERQTNADGTLDFFPIEQTLPSVGLRQGFGFTGWNTSPDGTGDRVTLDTVFAADTNLYAIWGEVPSLHMAYADYFLMGGFQDYGASPTGVNRVHIEKHYNILCPVNSFKLDSMINSTAMRNNFITARTEIMVDETLTEDEKSEALQKASEQVVLAAGGTVQTHLNNVRAWNAANPDDLKFVRFHVVAWHGGQQPRAFFTNGFVNFTHNAANYARSLATPRDLTNPNFDEAPTTRATMKARLDNLMRLLMEKYAPYSDIIVSWDIINEPVDDFTGQIRNTTDSNSQLGQWGFIWHDADPALNEDGSRKYYHRTPEGLTADEIYAVINDQGRLYDESEWLRVAMESAGKWSKHYGADWGLYVTDYMDSNKLYTKLQPTIDIMEWIRKESNLSGRPFGYGMQGRLAWAYPTLDMLRQQLDDVLEFADQIGLVESDIRSDFEPNPFFDPTQPTRLIQPGDTPQWNPNDLNSGSGSSVFTGPGQANNTLDTHNSPVRRIPEWGRGNGMSGTGTTPSFLSERFNTGANNFAISEELMKRQADFAADFFDLLVERKDRISLFQWDGFSDANTFNSSKGAHIWVNNVTGRTGMFEKYAFYAVIGSPARDKLRQAIAVSPAVADFAGFSAESWAVYSKVLSKAEALLDQRIYTLEGVIDVQEATEALYAAAKALEAQKTLLTYNANYFGSDATVRESHNPGTSVSVKSAAAVGFSREGFILSGWNTKADGKGISYAAGSNIVMNSHVMFFAQWERVAYPVTVIGGSGSGNYIPGRLVVLEADDAEQGYAFTDWDLSPNINEFTADTTATSPMVRFLMPATAVTARANWERIPITSIRIDSLSIATVARREVYNFRLVLNEGALGDDIEWSIADPSLGYVDTDGTVTIFDRTGNVRLTATAPNGLSHSITLRIAS